ncbi:MAG: type II secretion system protein N [Candidatus Thiodiazotropha sp. (ex. Lucinoma kazani)]
MKALLITLLLLLMAILALEWMTWPGQYNQALLITSAPQKVAPENRSQINQSIWLKEQQAYLAIADSTLFREDRQGFQREMKDPAAIGTNQQLPKFRLLGIILTDHLEPSALIYDEQIKKSQTLHIGDLLGSWTLQEINPEYIVLGRQGQTEKIALRKF